MNSNKHEGGKRKFYHVGEAWYSSTALGFGMDDEVVIGVYHPDGGTTGEFSVRWSKVGRESTPMLCAFDDSWSALSMFQDVLKKMAEIDDHNIMPDEFCYLLLECGVEDATPTEYPNRQPEKKNLYSKVDSKADIEAARKAR